MCQNESYAGFIAIAERFAHERTKMCSAHFRPVYDRRNRPTEQPIQERLTKFRTNFILLHNKPLTRLRRVHTEENIGVLAATVAKDPSFVQSSSIATTGIVLFHSEEDLTEDSFFEACKI